MSKRSAVDSVSSRTAKGTSWQKFLSKRLKRRFPMELAFLERFDCRIDEQMLALCIQDTTRYLERWCGKLETFWEFRVHAFFSLLTVFAYCVSVYDGVFSGLVALAATIQLSGQVILLMQVAGRKTVHGISINGVVLNVLALWLRLSCNMRYSAYLPTDYSGTWFYQLLEGLSMFSMVFLLLQAMFRYGAAADRSNRRFFMAMVPLALAFAFFSHPARHPMVVPNVCWMAAIYLDMASVIPQLRAYIVDFAPISGHWIFCSMIARGINLVFWNVASQDFDSLTLKGNISLYCLVASQCFHFCMLFCLFLMHVVNRVLDYDLPWSLLV